MPDETTTALVPVTVTDTDAPGMMLETTVILFKAMTVTAIGFFTPWSASLAQYIGQGTWPPSIVWYGVILPASVIGAASALNAFLSSSYNTYQQQKKANDSGQTQVVETKPTSTVTVEPPKP